MMLLQKGTWKKDMYTDKKEQNNDVIQSGSINKWDRWEYSIKEINYHYSDYKNRYDAKNFSEEDLYRLEKMDAPIYTYPKEVKNFIKKNNYTPWDYFIKLQDNESQLIAERQEWEEIENWIKMQMKLNEEANINQIQELKTYIQKLNKKYNIISIERPEIKNHNPSQSWIYWNNYYRIKTIKRDNGKYETNDDLQKYINQIPYKDYISQNWIVQSYGDTDPNDPKMWSNDWYLNKILAWEWREAINNIEWKMKNPWEATTIVWVVDDGGIQTKSHVDLQKNTIRSPSMSTISNHFHWTHVIGTVASDTNNWIGVPAISYNFIKVAVGWTDFQWGGQLSNLKTQSDRAIDKWAIAISWSRGCIDTKQEAEASRWDWIRQRTDTLFIIAAWNDNVNPDIDKASSNKCISPNAVWANPWTRVSTPAWVNADNIFTVAASTQSDTKAYFSSYGSFVDITAPWVSIISTINGNGYEAWPGTSMATPQVTSLVWLLAGTPKWESLSVMELKQIIIDTADPLSRQGGWAWRINVCAAVAAIGYPCKNYKVKWCTIWSGQNCQIEGAPEMCKAWTQTCIEDQDNEWSGIRWECVAITQPWDNPELCTDTTNNDEDCNRKSNCADLVNCCDPDLTTCQNSKRPDATEYYCQTDGSGNPSELTCDDEKDNDGDGLIDCDDDLECWLAITITASKAEICSNTTVEITLTAVTSGIVAGITYEWTKTGSTDVLGTGRTLTGSIDTAGTYIYKVKVANEKGCDKTASKEIKYREKETEICDDEIDNDCDELEDCDDESDCAEDVACANPHCEKVENCSNDKCEDLPRCQLSESSCCDGLDNDNDGKIDCLDSDCCSSSWPYCKSQWKCS